LLADAVVDEEMAACRVKFDVFESLVKSIDIGLFDFLVETSSLSVWNSLHVNDPKLSVPEW
jgi:hypothetical protein